MNLGGSRRSRATAKNLIYVVFDNEELALGRRISDSDVHERRHRRDRRGGQSAANDDVRTSTNSRGSSPRRSPRTT